MFFSVLEKNSHGYLTLRKNVIKDLRNIFALLVLVIKVINSILSESCNMDADESYLRSLLMTHGKNKNSSQDFGCNSIEGRVIFVMKI